jgi:hypothetical protein
MAELKNFIATKLIHDFQEITINLKFILFMHCLRVNHCATELIIKMKNNRFFLTQLYTMHKYTYKVVVAARQPKKKK